MANKIDSNVSGTRIAEEVQGSIGVLPSTPNWRPREPNSFSDFGAEVTTVARRPINDSRQLKKGVTTDLDASGGINEDLTQENWQQDLQGFMFADLRLKAQTIRSIIDETKENVPTTNVDGTNDEFDISNLKITVAAVAAGGTGYVVGDVITATGGTSSTVSTFTVATVSGGAVLTVTITNEGRYSVVPGSPVSTTGGTGTGCTLTLTDAAIATYRVGDLLLSEGYTNAANNVFSRIDVVTADVNIGVIADLVNEASPPAAGHLTVVGFQFDAGDADITNSGSAFPTLATTTKDCTELGLVPGEWVRLGGDVVATQFATVANNGFARVRSVTANLITFDKTESSMVTENTSTETIQIFLGRVLKNEQAALQKRRTYQIERTLGLDSDGIMSEYIIGQVPSEFVLNSPTADKIMVDASYVGTDNEQRTGLTGVKSGTRPALVESDAFNTSSDYTRIKISTVSLTDGNITALFAFAQDLSITINNNLTPNKAVATLGSFDVTAGSFQVSAAITAYFADVAAVQAVRNNSDITIDLILAKNNAGMVIDLPLVALGDGRLNVELDSPITLPLTIEAGDGAAVDSALNHTLMFCFFDYLPTASEA